MLLDRSKAPSFTLPSEFSLPIPQQVLLQENRILYFFPTPGIAAVKLEIIGKSGRTLLPLTQALVPSFTLQMLQEGTLTKSSQELADFFDFHAAEVHPYLSYSQEGLSLLSIKKHLLTLLPTFISLFSEATFPAENLEKRKSQRRLSLKLEQEKSASRANQLFKTSLFGPQHPIGQEITEAHVDLISPELLQAYYKQHLWKECDLFLCGDFTSEELAVVVDQLNLLPLQNEPQRRFETAPQPTSFPNEDRADALQSSVRVGSWSIPKTHADYPALAVFNTILGGFFGSRLIKNIREDKGHTYGISSSLVEVRGHAYWIVAADVKKAHREEVLDEINKEIQLLCTVLVDTDELEVLRNYLIGQLFTKFSSPFDLSDQFKAVHFSGLDFSFYESRLDFLKRFTAEDLRSIGQRYYGFPPLVEVSVG
jgi:predicted Zn-dependent peptidase